MIATWEHEHADPEVGLLTDDLTHTCTENLLGDSLPAEAIVTGTSPITLYGQPYVAQTTVYSCPACGATTSFVEHWPASFFAEPGRE